MAEESRTAVVAALAGNAALAVLKGVAAVSSGSAAMLAETFHSVSDTGNQLLLLLGMRLARRPPGSRHPFGHGRNVYFWSFVVSMLLFTLGGAFSIREGVHKLFDPGTGAEARYGWAYGVLAGALLFESLSLAVGVRALYRAKGAQSFVEYLHDSRDPMLPTVVLEDSAALVSIVLAAAGIAATQLTGHPLWDALASGVIGLMLIGVAMFLAYENYSLLIGESTSPETQAAIRRAILEDPAVARVVGIRTLHLAPEEILVAATVDFLDDQSVPDVEAAVPRLHGKIRAAVPHARFILVEPASGADPASGRRAPARGRLSGAARIS
jgi:cation diffusion facilitator family transporter